MNAPFVAWKTIAAGLAQGRDNFLLLRFIAAAMVVYGHAPAISGGEGPRDLFIWLDWGTYSGSIAVDIFFIVSGFLVAGSYARRRSPPAFAWARVIRILPAYAACLLACALVIGPFFSVRSFGQYISDPQTYAYVYRNLLFSPDMAWSLPGVFANNPQTASVNGSLWTLPAEIRMYLALAIIGLLGILSRRWALNATLAAVLVLMMLFPDNIPLVPHPAYLRLAALFAGGVLCYANRAWIPVHGAVLLAAGVLSYALRRTVAYPIALGVCEIAFVFWFAYNLKWHGFNRFGDYSYGLYLWGWPAQQMIAAALPNLGFLPNAAAALAVALVLAIVSWHFIERPALQLKTLPSRFPVLIPGRWTSAQRDNVFPTVKIDFRHERRAAG